MDGLEGEPSEPGEQEPRHPEVPAWVPSRERALYRDQSPEHGGCGECGGLQLNVPAVSS